MATTNNIPRDGHCESAWQEGLNPIAQKVYEVKADTVYDCLIVGGGITGLTAALLLQKAGKQVLIAPEHSKKYGRIADWIRITPSVYCLPRFITRSGLP